VRMPPTRIQARRRASMRALACSCRGTWECPSLLDDVPALTVRNISKTTAISRPSASFGALTRPLTRHIRCGKGTHAWLADNSPLSNASW